MSITHLQPMFQSHKNQSIDLHCQPVNWFLYDENTGL